MMFMVFALNEVPGAKHGLSESAPIPSERSAISVANSFAVMGLTGEGITLVWDGGIP